MLRERTEKTAFPHNSKRPGAISPGAPFHIIRSYGNIRFGKAADKNQSYAAERLYRAPDGAKSPPRTKRPRFAFLFVERSVCRAGSVIGAFKILRAECVPCCRTENLLLGNIVKSHGDAEH